VRFLGAIQLARMLLAGRPRPQRRRPALLDTPLANALDRRTVDLQGLRDRLIGPPGTGDAFVHLEQDAGMGQRAGRRLATCQQVFQVRSLLGHQFHPIGFVHARHLTGFYPHLCNAALMVQ